MKYKNCFLKNHTVFGDQKYITPEDCAKQAKKNPQLAAISFLEILGSQSHLGIEDRGLCAFVIWEEMKK